MCTRTHKRPDAAQPSLHPCHSCCSLLLMLGTAAAAAACWPNVTMQADRMFGYLQGHGPEHLAKMGLEGKSIDAHKRFCGTQLGKVCVCVCGTHGGEEGGGLRGYIHASRAVLFRFSSYKSAPAVVCYTAQQHACDGCLGSSCDSCAALRVMV